MDNLRNEMLTRWNEKGGTYDNGAHGIGDPAEIEAWKKLFEACPSKTKHLDVGAGTGFVSLIAAECDMDVTALDWSDTMLNQAKTKAEEQNLVINFVQGVTETLPFEDAAFELLTARHVMWTLAEPEQAFREWGRVLKEGGRAWADYSPRIGPGHHYSEDVENSLPLNKNIAPEIIAELFQKAGFRDVGYTVEEKGHAHGDHIHKRLHYFFTCTK